MNCTKLKKLYNQTILSGERNLTIKAKDVTINELEDIKECVYNVIERIGEKKEKLFIITEQI